MKNLALKYLAKFSHCQKRFRVPRQCRQDEYNEVHRPYESPRGHKRPPRVKSERLTGVAICPADKTQDRNAYIARPLDYPPAASALPPSRAFSSGGG